MSHFAEVDPSTNTVIRVIVAEQDFIDTGAVGEPSRWIQTSYNTRQGVHYGTAANGAYLPDGGTALRGNYAGAGYEYHSGMDVFVPPKANSEWESWTISTETYQYEPPIAMPNTSLLAANQTYEWSESTYQANNQTGWIVITFPDPE